MINDQTWLSKGYDPTTLEHRKLLTSIVKQYQPFDTLLDVGCATGADLALYEMAFPSARFTGFDIGLGDIEQAKKHLSSDYITTLYGKDLREELVNLPSKSFDIVTSNGVMMYADPHYLKELPRIAKKAVILSEKDPHRYNMLEYLIGLGLKPTITKITEEIRPTWATDGYIYEIAC